MKYEDEDVEDYASAEGPVRATSAGTARPSEARPQPAAPRSSPTSMLLEGLKEELFHLEVERQQGRISHQEYETAKSALDQTLQRALKREAQKA